MWRQMRILNSFTLEATFSGTAIQRYVFRSLVVRKPVFGVSDQVPLKPGCTIIQYGYRFELPDLGSRGIVLSVYRKQRR